jgi:hypothetical protein
MFGDAGLEYLSIRKDKDLLASSPMAAVRTTSIGKVYPLQFLQDDGGPFFFLLMTKEEGLLPN